MRENQRTRKQLVSPSPIDPAGLIHPKLLPYSKKIRSGKKVEIDQEFEVPCRWNETELAKIHDGLREWLKQGSPEVLAKLLKDDPFRIVHPVIGLEIRHLSWLSRRCEQTDSLDEFYVEEQHGPLFPPGTRHAARTALLTIFQGMWSAFSPSTTLHYKARKVRGAPRKWQGWEMRDFLELEYNPLREYLDKLDRETNQATYPLRRRPGETESAYLKRIVEIVTRVDKLSGYAFTSKKILTGPHKGEFTIDAHPLSLKPAQAIARQAIQRRSVQKHILLAGLFAHYFGQDHTKWKALDRIIQRAEELYPHLHRRKARHV